MSESQNKFGKDDFHRERSRFLDAFAGLEEVLLGSPSALKDPQLAKSVKALQAIRNDLVHSQLRFAQLDGALHAVAINTKEVSVTARSGRVLRFEDFADLTSQIGNLKRALS